MIVAGIDYSTRAVDIVTTDVRWSHYDLCGDTAFDRTRSVRDALPARSSEFWDEVIAAGIEEPMARGKLSGSLTPKLKAVQGAILACLPARLLVAPLTASEWRKAVGLPGNASKAAVAEWVALQYYDIYRPLEFLDWPQDACDAYCIARAVASRVREGEPA